MCYNNFGGGSNVFYGDIRLGCNCWIFSSGGFSAIAINRPRTKGEKNVLNKTCEEFDKYMASKKKK